MPRSVKSTKVNKNSVKKSKFWTDEEKLALLENLKSFGYENIHLFCDSLPMKQKREIRMKILELMVTAKNILKNKNLISSLDYWLQILPMDESVIQKALLYISLFEKHPKSQCNFKLIYYILYQITSGFININLPSGLKKLLWQILKEIKPQESNNNIMDTMDYVSAEKKAPIRVYQNKVKSSL